MRLLRMLATLTLLHTMPLLAQNTYTPEQAKSHIGERGTVCGVVASAHFSASSKGQPTFLNLGKPYPSQIFTVLIWGSDRPKFGAPERDYNKKNICASGAIEEFRGTPEIIARNPSQILVK